MSAPIRRFDPYYKDDFGFRVTADMGESSTGDWVDYSDYAALEAHNQQMREALTNLLAVARSLDTYERYGAVRRHASDALAVTEPKP
jgi:hypothetical protein